MFFVPQYRVSEVAELLGVSDDTVRRWVDAQQLPAESDGSGRLVVEGSALAGFARARARAARDPSGIERSARNRFVGLVTEVTSDTVMSQVELQCGSQRVVSLLSTEAVTDLGLRPGVLAVAVVKSTAVVIETPGGGQ
ncbi:helix-turn-helix transcriptional regulator [Actinopolyspora lacussalsi]